MSVKTSARQPEVTYSVRVDVSGADPVRKKFGKMSLLPSSVSLSYRETSSGWLLTSATVYGPRILKEGTGQGLSERLWSNDDWPDWVREAARDHAPTGSLL